MKLTKNSENTLMNWHAGCGHVFISDGSGKGLVRSDIGFIKNGKEYFILAISSSKVLWKEINNHASRDSQRTL